MTNQKSLYSREFLMKALVKPRNDLIGTLMTLGYFEGTPFTVPPKAEKVVEISELLRKKDSVEIHIFLKYTKDENGMIVQLETIEMPGPVNGFIISFRFISPESLMDANGFCLNSSLIGFNPWELANVIVDNAPY